MIRSTFENINFAVKILSFKNKAKKVPLAHYFKFSDEAKGKPRRKSIFVQAQYLYNTEKSLNLFKKILHGNFSNNSLLNLFFTLSPNGRLVNNLFEYENKKKQKKII